MTPDEIRDLERYLTPAEREELYALIDADLKEVIWRPLPGPQTMAYESLADIIGYGGAAGGGKTDLACGKALTQHSKVAIFRREGTQLTGIIDRLTELLGGRDGYNGQEKIWREAGPRSVQVEFGSVPNLGDETKHQGRPKDLLVIDEAANFLESQVRFLMGWVRTVVPGQRCQTLMTFNPPTSAEGRWVIEFFAPWLDKKHPNPAKPGELRYFATIDGKDVEVASGEPFMHKGERIKPMSRTFIPSRISDNPYLMGTGYMATLQSLPEPLRSQMLNGDFAAGMEDDPWQVIPTRWVEIAQERWKARSPKGEMLTQGVDVARGGKDNTVIANRHVGNWFDELKLYPGKETPDGPAVAGLVIAERRDSAPVLIDVIGVGSSPYDVLNGMDVQVIGVNMSETAPGTDKSGMLRFLNTRSMLWWRAREALDPANDTGIALPPDKGLLSELCMPKWEVSGKTIKVESREDIVKRLGRSPDRATAVILALMDVPKLSVLRAAKAQDDVLHYDPYANR